MSGASKNLATKHQPGTGLDLGYKNKEEWKKFVFSYFIGKSYFGDDCLQIYLIFQPVFKYFQIFTGSFGKILDGNLKSCQKKVL